MSPDEPVSIDTPPTFASLTFDTTPLTTPAAADPAQTIPDTISPTGTSGPMLAGDESTARKGRLSRPLARQTGDKPRKGMLSRITERNVPRPPYLGQKLGRREIEQLLLTEPADKLDLRGADLREADLEHMNLTGVRLGEDDPLASEQERREFAARLDRARLAGAHLDGCIAVGVSFEGADMRAVTLTHANLMMAALSGAYLAHAQMTSIRLTDAVAEGATLTDANLSNGVLVGVRLRQARLRGANLSGTDLGLADLRESDLRYSLCDERTHFGGALLNGAWIDGFRLRDADLASIDWSTVATIGEEREAGTVLPNARAGAYRLAARTCRRLGLALRAQGMTPEGQRFTARARQMERHARWAEVEQCWRGRRYIPLLRAGLRWAGTAIQGVTTGYGEHPSWALGWAAGVAIVCALLYMVTLPARPDFGNALLLSISALFGHGYASLPILFLNAGSATWVSVGESLAGTVLGLLFTLALARKTLE